MNIEKYGFTADMTRNCENRIPARVTAVHKERYAVVCEQGETYARLKSSEYYAGAEVFPTAGDFVLLDYNPSGDSRITATLPRRTCFSRRNPGPIPVDQAVAANFDYVFIMQSLNQNFNEKRLERYLTLAWQSGAKPVVLLTKEDLVENYWDYLTRAEQVAAGVNIHVVSARTGYGLERLNAYLQPGKTIVFLGSSGVGKSSLVNALAGSEVMTVGGIREADGRGRHTTTHRQLLMLPGGYMIIDTPGMRELGMWDVSEGLDAAFADVEAHLGKCRFRDCRHKTEPGCAVKAAIESGELDISRWESYQKLKEEAVYAQYPAMQVFRKKEWGKQVAKEIRRINKEEWK